MGITNEVLAERLDGVSHLIEEKFNTNDVSHDAILTQVRKTNGTVIVNTQRISTLEIWQNRIIGGLIVPNIVFLPIIFVIIKNWLDGK